MTYKNIIFLCNKHHYLKYKTSSYYKFHFHFNSSLSHKRNEYSNRVASTECLAATCLYKAS
jgi:hypothetical protein